MAQNESPAPRFVTYRDFWPHYLREHGRPKTRAIHFFGTALVLLLAAAILVTGRLWLIPVLLVAGYGPAWIGHFFIEHNRPATFTYPLWSLLSDFRMAGLWAIGRLGPELERASVRPLTSN